MMFRDREDAGIRLARALEAYRDQKDVLVLAIPRGGVEVGWQVARHLRAEFSLIIARKLPYPDNPEAGFGAIAEDGSTFIFSGAAFRLSEETVNSIAEEQKEEIQRRVSVLRRGRPLPEIRSRRVILVDDGIAMGSTMRASIRLCRNRGAGKVIVAAPVAGIRVAREIGQLADEVVILETPTPFYAVAQVYQNWYDVSDREVIEITERWEKEQGLTRSQRMGVPTG